MVVGDGTIWAISVSLRTVVSDASSLQLMCSALLVEMLVGLNYISRAHSRHTCTHFAY